MSELLDMAMKARDKELDFKREQMDRAAVASGNVDENSALYRHAKLNGWNMGPDEPFRGQAGRKWWAAEQAAKGRMTDARADMMEADADLRAGYDGIVANATAQRLDRARRGRATLGSIVGHAMRNGGMVPRELAQSVGMELGDPGFVGGTLAKDGTFMSLGRGGKGDIQPTGVVSPLEVLKAMKDSGNWRDAQKYMKQFLKGRLTDQQIESATGVSPQWVQEMVNVQASESDRKFQLEGLKILADMQKSGGESRPVDAVGFYTKNPKLAERFLTDYERDESGNIKMVEGKDGMVPMEVRLSPEEASERAMKYFEGLQKKLAQGGGGENDAQKAIIDGIRALTTPKPADPNAVAMRQRANARANAIDAAGGRQQLIYEQMPDGTLTTTSGYVANGRVYDKNGDERQGQFLDENRRPIVPAAQPAQGGDVHTDERGTWQAVRDANGRVVGKKLIAPAQSSADYGLRNDGQPPAQGGAVSDMEKPVITLGGGTQTQEQTPTSQKEPLEQKSSIGSAVLSAEDERFLDETLKELEAPEEPDVSVSIPSDSPDYERRVRKAEARRKREELPDWVKGLSPEEQTKYKAARTAKRGIEAITKEMGKTQGASSASTADSYAAMLDALGPGGVLRNKLSRLLSIIDKVGESMNSDF